MQPDLTSLCCEIPMAESEYVVNNIKEYIHLPCTISLIWGRCSNAVGDGNLAQFASR